MRHLRSDRVESVRRTFVRARSVGFFCLCLGVAPIASCGSDATGGVSSTATSGAPAALADPSETALATMPAEVIVPTTAIAVLASTDPSTPASKAEPESSAASPSMSPADATTRFSLGDFVFSYPASLGLVPVPGHLFTRGDPSFPSISQDFGDGHGRLVTMTIAVGGQQLIDSNAAAGDPLATVLIGDRTFYTPNHHDDPTGFGLMYIIGDHVAAFGFSLFTWDEALAIAKDITVAAGSETSSEPQTTTAPSSETSSEPQTTGVIELTALAVARLSYSAASNCYFLADPVSGVGQSVIWPDNTTPATDGSGIHAGARWIPVGSIVSGGGGGFASNPLPHFDDRPACLVGSSDVFIFNAGTHLDVGTGLGP
jgi:hypothetical protein